MTDDLEDDDAPPETTVEAAAAAIEDLLKQKPGGADGEAREEAKAPDARDEVKQPAAPDPAVAEASRKVAEAEAARAQFTTALNHLVPQLQQAVMGEFGDIRTADDAARLSASDPQRYNRFVIAQNNLANAQRQQGALAAQEHHAGLVRLGEWRSAQVKKLGELMPELHDNEAAPALIRKLSQFAHKSGYTPQQMSQASAADIAMLHRAMQFENLQGAQDLARAKAAHAPKVSEPGTRAQGGGKGEAAQADFARLKKSGRTEDAAALFKTILS